MNVNAENTKQLSAPQKLPDFRDTGPLSPDVLGGLGQSVNSRKILSFAELNDEEIRAAPKIPRSQASHQLLTANFKMATKGESDWMRDCTPTRDKISEESGYEISPRKRTKVVQKSIRF